MSQNLGYQHIMQIQMQSPGQNNQKQYDVLEQQPQPQIIGQQALNEQSGLNVNQQRYKSFRQILMIILNVSLSSFYFGYTLAYLSAVDFDTIVEVYNIRMKKQLAEGLLIGCMPIGGGIGALTSSFLIQKYSRRQRIHHMHRNCLMIVNAIAFLTGLLLFIPHTQTLLLARIIQGVCAGFFSSLAPLIMKQLSPTQISGTLTSCNQIFIAFGVFFAFAFSQTVQRIFSDPSSKQTWWVIFGLPLIVLSAQTFVFHFIYNFETPKYLYLKNRDDQGRSLIQLIYKPEYVDSAVRQIKSNIGRVQTQISENGSQKDQFQSVSLTTPRSAVLVAIHLAALQQFSGINAVMAYGGQIVGQSAPSLKLVLPVLINFEQVVASIFASYLLTKIGRKTMIQYGCIGGAFSCTTIAIGFFLKSSNQGLSLALIIIGLIIFMANFGLTLGPVVWVYLPQIIQPAVLPYATGVNWGTSAFIMLLFPVIKQNLPNKNPALLFLFFAFWCAFSLVFNKKYLIQTKSKTEKQIFQEYRIKAAFC